MGLFVKFCKYNEYTLQNLLLNQVRFSTVYDFNDFNDLNYTTPFYEGMDIRISDPLKDYLNGIGIKKLADLIDHGYKSGIYTKEYLDEKLRNIPLKDLKLEGPLLNFLFENIAYSNVGIFCCSGIEVFKNDAAQLMFAHYAESNKGLALVYEIPDDSLKKIQYEKLDRKPGSAGLSDRVLKWIKSDYTDINDFITKSKYWEYENEYRIFNSPGNHQADKLDIELKGIFYTPRSKSDLNTLRFINDKIYSSNLFIQEIAPNPCYFRFKIPPEHKSDNDWSEVLFFLNIKSNLKDGS